MTGRTTLRLLQGGLARGALREGSLATGTATGDTEAPPPRLLLGRAGTCPGYPTLLICLFDDSPSVTSPSGSDPISARYDEAQQAFAHIARRCTCKQCMAAVIHFDMVGGCDPLPLARSWPTGRQRLPHALRASLRVPGNAPGCSVLGGALDYAEQLISRTSTDTQVSIVAFSDFALLDADPVGVIDRLASVDGDVHAVVLGRQLDPRGLDERIRLTTIDWNDPPGGAARALLDSLTTQRPGSQLPLRPS